MKFILIVLACVVALVVLAVVLEFFELLSFRHENKERAEKFRRKMKGDRGQ